MSRETTLAAFSNLHQGRSRGAEAPHKPLLVLFALSQWLRHGTTIFRFTDVEEPVGALVRDPQFGGAETATPRDPFWFLRNDSVWVVESGSGAEISYTGDRPTPGELRDQEARGRFSAAVATNLFASPGLAIELVGGSSASTSTPPSRVGGGRALAPAVSSGRSKRCQEPFTVVKGS
jgi:putative restriction endonuclease